MKTKTRIKRFSIIDRLFHLFLMLTFLLQTATGFSRLYVSTVWGQKDQFVGRRVRDLLVTSHMGGRGDDHRVPPPLCLSLTRIEWRTP